MRTAEQIALVLSELKQMAQQAELGFLGHLLEMAELEAWNIERNSPKVFYIRNSNPSHSPGQPYGERALIGGSEEPGAGNATSGS